MPKGDGKIRKLIQEEFPEMSEEKQEEVENALYELAELFIEAYGDQLWVRREDRKGEPTTKD